MDEYKDDDVLNIAEIRRDDSIIDRIRDNRLTQNDRDRLVDILEAWRNAIDPH